MALYEDIIQNTKSKNTNVNKHYIRNQKVLNIIFMVLLVSIIIADVLYIIKSNMLGIIHFSFLVMIISVSCEGAIFLILSLVRFNFENKILKFFVIITFFAPLVAYVPMMSFSDGYSILFFVIRIVLILSLIYIAKNKGKYTDLRYYIFRDIYYVLFASIFILSAVLFIFANEKRRIDYSFNKELNGYVLNEVLEGTANVDIKEGTVKIDDNSLVKADNTITIPESVKDVSSNAFVGSNVDTLYVKSKEINLMAALNNSKIKNVYLENKDTKILDIDLINVNDIRFYTSKENIDAYRFNNDKYGYLFVPVCDDNEFYIVYNGTNKKIDYYHKGDTLEAPSNFNANIDGRLKFVRWYYANDPDKEVTFPITVEGNIELSAVWSQVYKFTFDYAGGTVIENETFKNNPETLELCKEDGNLILPTLYKDNYRFDGWYDEALGEDNIITSIKTEYFSDVKLKAKFSKVYKLNYHSNGGYIPDDEMNQEYIEGDEIIPATPIKTGYRFVGWYLEPEFTTKVERITEEGTELYAKFEAIEYNITFNTFGGVNPNGMATYTIEDDINLEASVKNGYRFVGWYSDSNYQNEVDNLLGQYGDLVLYAKYEIITYNITFDVQTDNPINYTIETDYSLRDARKAGYRFVGWFNESNEKIENTLGLYGDLTLYARFEMVTYSINYVLDGGTNTNTISSYNIETNYNLIDSSKVGYVFLGWYNDSNYQTKVENLNGLYGELVLYARFEANIYVVNYNANGGIVADNTQDIAYDSNYELLTPTRLGYDFLGWFNNDVKFENGKWNRLDGIDLIAKWEISAPIITMSNDIDKVYDGNYSDMSIGIEHPLSNEYSCTIRWYKVGNSIALSTNKNTYRVKDVETAEYYCHISIAHAGNTKELNTNSINVNIVRADYEMSEIKAKYDKKDFRLEFNDEIQKPIIENLPVGEDGIELMATYEYSKEFKNVGTTGSFTVKFSSTSKNYNIPEDIISYVTIVPRKLTVAWNELTHIYDGNVWHPTGTLENTLPGYDVTLKFDETNNRDAKVHEIGFSIIDENEVYELEVDSVEYEILKADYDTSGITFNKTSFVYDGTYHLPVPTNLPEGITFNEAESIGLKDVVTNGIVTLKFNNANSNYNDIADVTIEIMIDPKEVNVVLTKTSFKYTGNILVPDYVIEGLVQGDEITATITNESINVGSYTAEITLSSNNYRVSDDSDLEYSIVKADYDLSNLQYETLEFTYNKEAHIPVPTNLPEGLSLDSDHSIGIVSVGEDSKAVLKLVSSNPNYNSVDDLEVAIVIRPKTVTATISGDSSFVYNKYVQTPEIAIDGLITGDTTNYIVTNESINVGSYNAVIVLDNNNYVIDTECVVEYSITKAGFDIEYTISDVTVTYDGNPHHPSISTIKKYTFDQNEIRYEFLDEYVDAGTYNSRVKFFATDNFQEVIINGIVKIEKKEIELEFDSLTHEYNNELFIPQVTGYIGVVTGDVVVANVVNTDTIETGNYVAIIELSGTDYDNYVVNKEYRIYIFEHQVDLTGFTINNYEGEYDGQKHTVSVTGLPQGVTAVFDKEYVDVCTNAQVKITFVTDNPNIGYSNQEVGYVTITPKNVTISYDSTELTYNGEVQHPNATVNGVVAGDIVNVTFDTQSKDVSTYNNVTVTIDNSNYKIDSGSSLSYSIVACHVTLVWGNLDLTYNRTVQKPTATVKYNGETLNTIVNVEGSNNINVGTYTATATVEDHNYVVEGSPDVTYHIIQRELELEWNSLIFYYNGQSQAPEVTGEALVGDNVDIIVNVNGEHIIPNTYTATASILNDNYKILGDNTVQFKIIPGIFDKEELSQKVQDLTTYTYDKTEKSPNISQVKSYATDGNEIIATPSTYPTLAGSYYVDVDFTTSNGYYEKYTKTVRVVINKLELDITLDSNVFEFDNTIKKPSVIINNIISGDEVIVNVTNTNSAIQNNIEVTMTLTGANSSNYKISKKYYYSIVKGNIDMSGVIYSNTTLTYNGEYQLPLLSNLPQGVAIDEENSIGVKNISDTKATIKYILTGEYVDNYNLPQELEIAMVVNPRKLNVTWVKTTFGYDGNLHYPTYTLNQYDGDLVELIFPEGKSEIGTYTMTSSSTNNSNYIIDEVSTTMIITAGTFDMSGVSFNNREYTYDGALHESIRITGTLPDGVKVSYSYDDDNEGAYLNVGEYGVTAIFTTNNANYVTPEPLTAKIIINKKILQVSWSSLSFVYDDQEHVPTATIVGVITGENVEYEVTGASIYAGNHTAQVLLTNSNYKLDDETKSVSFVINKASYDTSLITFNNKTVEYNGLEQTIEMSGLASIKGLDNSSVSVNIEGSRTNVGTTTVVATFTTDSNNYEAPAPITRTLTVTPKMIDVTVKLDGVITTARSFSKNFDGKPYNFTAEYDSNDLVQGDDLDITIQRVVLVGTYNLSMEFSNENYSTEKPNLSITINGASYYDVSWDYNTGKMYPEAKLTINGESIYIEGLGDGTNMVYYKFYASNGSTLLDSAPTTSGTYQIEVVSNYSGIEFYSWASWKTKVKYKLTNNVINWSYDGKNISTAITTTGNDDTKPLTYGGVTYTKGLKMENSSGQITITVSDETTIQILVGNNGAAAVGKKLKIDGSSTSVSNNSGIIEVTLSSGTHIITKDNPVSVYMISGGSVKVTETW